MTKKVRLIVATVLAAMLVFQAGPAGAQEEPQGPSAAQYDQATEAFEGFGTVEFVGRKADGTRGYGLSVSAETGYYLEGDFDFAAFEGQRVFAAGQIVYSDGGRLLQVESLEPADAAEEGRTATFELTAEGPVPDGDSFYAYAPDGYRQQLTDPDGDGVYTGELSFPADGYPSDQPIPLSIGGLRGADDPNGYTIRDFGPTMVEDGQTFSATYVSNAGQDEATTASASAGATTPEPTAVAEATTPAATAGSGRGSVFGEGGALGFLPDSGGTAVLILAGGALLAGGGLLAFRLLGSR